MNIEITFKNQKNKDPQGIQGMVFDPTPFEVISLRKHQAFWFSNENPCQDDKKCIKIQRKSEGNQWILSEFKKEKEIRRKL